jgi:hypothetical protein
LIVWRTFGGESLVAARATCRSRLELKRKFDVLRMYNNIVPPSKLPPKADYFLFRVSLHYPRCLSPALTGFENEPSLDFLANRPVSSQLGRTRRTRMVVNGPCKCQGTRPSLKSTRCGCTPYVAGEQFTRALSRTLINPLRLVVFPPDRCSPLSERPLTSTLRLQRPS